MGELRPIPPRGASHGASAGRLRFGSFEADLGAGELRKGGLKIKLHAQSFTVLAMLLERPGEVVTREELQQRLWPSETFVDFEHGLNKAVNKLREALGDDADTPRYIETLPRRGYRFLAPVSAVAPVLTLPSTGASPAGHAEPEALPPDALPVPAGPRRRRWVLAASGAAVVVVVLFLAWNPGGLRNRLLGRQSAPPLDPKRVVVAAFENRTGDTSLDGLCRMATESVSEALLRINTIHVVPSSTVFEMTARESKTGRWGDPVRKLAESTSAGLVVSGAVYQQGQTLQIRATILDEVANKPLYAVEPASGPRDKAAEDAGVVAQRVTDVVAARYFNPYVDLLIEEVEPPRFEAQKEFLTGFLLFYSDPGAATVNLRRAIELDPEFVWPRYALAYAIDNAGKPGAAAQLDSIENSQLRLSPVMRRRLAWLRALFAGRLEEVYSIAGEIVKLVPEEPLVAIDLAIGAAWTNRPHEAVRTFQKVRGPPFFEPSHTLGVGFLMEWTGALHMLGEHEQELKEARWGRSLYPHLLNLHAYEARALVALGRLDEVDRLITEILAMPSTWSYSHCCLPHATPAYVMLAAAAELRAHGHREAALKMAGRAVDWYRTRAGAETRQEDARAGLGWALYQAERWDEAQAVVAALAAEHPSNTYYQGRLGTLAARRSDREEALRIAEKLRSRGTQECDCTFLSARILALLGDKDRAVALLRDSIAGGLTRDESDDYGYGFTYSHSMDLEPLHGYPPFEELIKPKD